MRLKLRKKPPSSTSRINVARMDHRGLRDSSTSGGLGDCLIGVCSIIKNSLTKKLLSALENPLTRARYRIGFENLSKSARAEARAERRLPCVTVSFISSIQRRIH